MVLCKLLHQCWEGLSAIINGHSVGSTTTKTVNKLTYVIYA